MSGTEIAVVGVGCRFPDARTPEEFWRNIEAGLVSMRPLPEDVLRASGVDERTLGAANYVRVGTRLPAVEDFAADFFGFRPREAELVDPQQRIFLEVAHEALERAGYVPGTAEQTVGVFAGSGVGPYSATLFAARARRDGVAAAVADLDLTLGGEVDFLPSRAAYKLGLRGPAVSVQTGCSSSLYAVHYATLSLLVGECDVALAGGSAVQEPLLGHLHQPGGAMSADGQCRSFDAAASGTVHGSGVGVVVLRRLADALADGDEISAVLHGTAVGNDGADKAGYIAPSPAGIARVVTAALEVSGVRGDQLRYAEAHGTATPLGDEVELAALTDAVGRTSSGTGFCRLGSVMSNVGHTGPTAGVAGLIKAIGIARTGVLPPHPSFARAAQPDLLAAGPFTVGTTAGRTTDDCFVLVDSVGMGGGDAAAVVGPPPARTRPAAPVRDTVRLVLSARTRTELDALSRGLADALDGGDLPAADVAYTLRVGRRHHEERRVVEAAPDRLAAALRLPRPPLVRTRRAPRRPAALVTAGATADAVDLLLDCLGPDTAVVPDAAAVPPGRHPVPAAGVGADDRREDADRVLTEAWLDGVQVNWSPLWTDAGHRVTLPAYPFTRQRLWALDRLDLAADTAGAGQTVGTAGADDVEAALLEIWRGLFGVDVIGLDDQFGRLGGTSLLSVQLALEIQNRFGCVLNVHRAGGSALTVRRLAELVRAQGTTAEPAALDDGLDSCDEELVDADLRLPLGELGTVRSRGRDVLLTGATGYLGAFLLRELLDRGPGTVHCVVRAPDEAAGLERLRAAARRFLLPEPDPDRVRVVPGDLRTFDGGPELAARIGLVLHCAARVVFTEPYRTLREDNVLPLAGLLRWVRAYGIRDFGHVSTLAATGPAMGSGNRYLETRQQPLDPAAGSYGVSKWVGERLLDRAEEDGLRVRVFRPGLIMAAGGTGAVNDKDLIFLTLVSGLAAGAHPDDPRMLSMAPVDVVARGIVELALTPASAGRAYHLVAERATSMRELFALLAEAGLPTGSLPLPEWQGRVRALALAEGNPILSAAALLELEGHDTDPMAVQAAAWQPWLGRAGADPRVTGAMLRRGIEYLAGRDPLVHALVGDRLDAAATAGAAP